MKFSNNIKLKLCQAALKKEVLIVNGINYLGQPFQSVGFIPNNLKYISETSICLCLGQTADLYDNDIYVNLFNTNQGDYAEVMYITSIHSANGVEIYKNLEMDEIKKTININKKFYDLDKDCEFSASLSKLIGKPIFFEGEPLILTAVRQSAGATNIDATNGVYYTGGTVCQDDVKIDKEAINKIKRLQVEMIK